MGVFLGVGQEQGTLRVSPQIPEAQSFLLEWRRENR